MPVPLVAGLDLLTDGEREADHLARAHRRDAGRPRTARHHDRHPLGEGGPPAARCAVVRGGRRRGWPPGHVVAHRCAGGAAAGLLLGERLPRRAGATGNGQARRSPRTRAAPAVGPLSFPGSARIDGTMTVGEAMTSRRSTGSGSSRAGPPTPRAHARRPGISCGRAGRRCNSCSTSSPPPAGCSSPSRRRPNALLRRAWPGRPRSSPGVRSLTGGRPFALLGGVSFIRGHTCRPPSVHSQLLGCRVAARALDRVRRSPNWWGRRIMHDSVGAATQAAAPFRTAPGAAAVRAPHRLLVLLACESTESDRLRQAWVGQAIDVE